LGKIEGEFFKDGKMTGEFLYLKTLFRLGKIHEKFFESGKFYLIFEISLKIDIFQILTKKLHFYPKIRQRQKNPKNFILFLGKYLNPVKFFYAKKKQIFVFFKIFPLFSHKSKNSGFSNLSNFTNLQ
jgi:hypothetical protein